MKLLKSLLLALVVGIVAFESQASELRILTWNVFMLPSPIKSSKQKMRTESIVQELVARQDQYDVMVFQEVFSGRFRKQLTNALAAAHPHSYHMGKGSRILHPFGPGLLLLSKYPFEIKDKVYYKQCSGADCLAAKGAFLAEVSLPAQKHVQIIVTHLQAGQKPKKRKIRATQVEQLRAFMQENKRAHVPQILAGDLNINGLNTEEFPEVINHLAMSAPFDTVAPEAVAEVSFFERLLRFASSRATETECFGKPRRDTEARHDHIWIGDEDQQTEVKSIGVTPIRAMINGAACDLSDHLPLSLHLAL